MKRIHAIYAQYSMLTACGRSTHGWQGPRTPLTTTSLRDVTCQACQKKVL